MQYLPAMAQGTFKTDDGIELYFQDSGPVDGQDSGITEPPLVFLYGLGCSIHHWKYPISYFTDGARFGRAKKRRRLVWADFRGHGKSERPLPGQRLTMDLICDDTAALCKYLGIERAVFLGQSMGGCLALLMAHRFPALTAALILLASPGRDPSRYFPVKQLTQPIWEGLIKLNERMPQVLRFTHQFGVPFAKLNPLVLLTVRETIRYLGFNPALSRTDDIEAYIADVFRVDPSLFFDMAKELGAFDVAHLDPPVSAPALIIAGAKDQVVSLAESKHLAAHLPHGELKIIPHGSHCPHFDDPGLVCRTMEAFLEQQGL